jgi:hypothetical protein
MGNFIILQSGERQKTASKKGKDKMSGDELAIRLFLIATAITFAGVAVSQAGWTQKFLIYSLFGAASLSVLGALFWGSIAERSPRIAEFARGVTASGIAWLTLLVVGIGAVLILDYGARVGWFGESASRISVGDAASSPKFPMWPYPYQPISVVGKTFRNERVLLDGHSYSNCEFHNVTFVYNGTTAVQFSNNKVFGEHYATDNQAVIGTITWLKGFNLLRENFNVEVPPGNVLIPAERKEK